MKVKLQDIYDELSEEVDSAIADKFYKGLKPKADETDRIDLDDAEVQLYIRDFMEELVVTRDYQADIANNILKQYYNTEYDVYDEIGESNEKLEEADEDSYENTFAKIIDQMEEAVSYDELYDIANDIIDEDLKSKVIEVIKQCDVDGDSVDVAYSIVTSDLLDMKRYDLNESKKLNEGVDIEDLFNQYTDIARDTYELEWNSADAKARKELAKKAITKFVQEHPEVKNVVKEFADKLEDENYHTDREVLNDLYKFESKKQTAFSKRLIKDDKSKGE